MKKVITAIFLAGLFYSSVIAQETEEKKKDVDLSGKFALMFQIGSNFNLSNFEGSTFSAKYQIDKKSAIRVSLSHFIVGSEYEQDDIRADTLFSTSKNEQDFGNLDLGIYYIRYLRTFDDIDFYLGAGPHISLENDENSRSITRSETTHYANDIRNNYGLSVLMGVEWYVKNNISFTAEYSFGYNYSVSHQSQPYSDLSTVREARESEWSFRGYGAKIGLSLYF